MDTLFRIGASYASKVSERVSSNKDLSQRWHETIVFIFCVDCALLRPKFTSTIEILTYSSPGRGWVGRRTTIYL